VGINNPLYPTLIVDCGSTELRGNSDEEKRMFRLNTIDYIGKQVEELLQHQVKPILSIIISHSHADHMNFFISVLSEELFFRSTDEIFVRWK